MKGEKEFGKRDEVYEKTQRWPVRLNGKVYCHKRPCGTPNIDGLTSHNCSRLCCDFRADQYVDGNMRARTSSIPARPYIEPFNVFSTLIYPSVCPLFRSALKA
jgi:hypothetical protein